MDFRPRGPAERGSTQNFDPHNQPLENVGQSAPHAFGALHVSNDADRLAPATGLSVDVDAIHPDRDCDSSAHSFSGGFESAPWRHLQTQPHSRPYFRFLARSVADRIDRYIYGLSSVADGRRHPSHTISHGGYAKESAAMGYRGPGQACRRPGFVGHVRTYVLGRRARDGI